MKKMSSTNKNTNYVFFIVCFFNLFICISLCILQLSELTHSDIINVIILYIISLVLYWFLNFIFYLKDKHSEQHISHLFSLLFSGLAITIMLFNVKEKVILLIPIMFLVSIFSISVLWEFLRGGKNEN